MFDWWPASGCRCALVAVLLAVALGLGPVESAARQYAGTDLLARLYTGSDGRAGSFLRVHPEQRPLFGFPLEPLSLSQRDVVRFPALEGQLLREILWMPTSTIAGGLFPVGAGPIEWAIGFTSAQRELYQNPSDGGAQAQLLSAFVKAGPLLSSSARGTVGLQLFAGMIDQGVQIGEGVRSRVMQNRALDQARMPLGLPQPPAVARQRVGTRSGAFELAGVGFRAQGGWKLEHQDGIRSSAFARLDFKNQFLPNGALVSTLGEPPPVLPLADRGTGGNPADVVLNSLGRALDLNWVGRNVGGGVHDNDELDDWGQFPLGDTRVPGKTLADAYARMHDIEYWVSTHFDEGTEVRVPSPDGGYEYYVSEGDPTLANLRVVARVASSLDPLAVLHALGTGSYLGPRTPAGDPAAVVDLSDRSAMTVVDPADRTVADREAVLSQAPGGSFSAVRISVDGSSVTVRRESRIAYTHTYDGAAVSRAVEEFNRTGVYDPAKHYGLSRAAGSEAGRAPEPYDPVVDLTIEPPEPESRRRPLVLPLSTPIWPPGPPGPPPPGGGDDPPPPPPGPPGNDDPPTPPPGSSGGDDPPPPPPGPPSSGPGGVDLSPRTVVSLGQMGLVDSIASLASAAAEALGPDRSVAEFDLGSERLIVARAGVRTEARRSSEPVDGRAWSPPPPGRFAIAQTDLAVQDEAGHVLVLGRFFDSYVGSDGGAWSWLPFELEIVSPAGAQRGSPAPRVVLLDRQAGLHFGYELTTGTVYASRSVTAAPRLEWDSTEGGYLARFAHGFVVRFDTSGRLMWTGQDDPADRVHYHFDGAQLTALVRGSLRITLSRDGADTVREAHSSAGHQVRYEWNARGALERVVTGTDSFRFVYDDAGLVEAQIPDSDDSVTFENRYDSIGRMVTRRTPLGSWSFHYTDLAGGGVRIDVDGARDDRSTFYYDARGRLAAYGSTEEGVVLLSYGEEGEIAGLAEASVRDQGSAEEPPRFVVDELILPLRPTIPANR